MSDFDYHPSIESRRADVMGLDLHYLQAGKTSGSSADAVTLLLHGWPTSSHLWRNIIPELSKDHWVVAPDLIGFGRSEKSLDAPYDFDFWNHLLEEFLAQLGAKKLNLVVHDLGGPIGLIWAVRHSNQLNRLVLLNTLVYSDLHWSTKLFMLMARIPGIRYCMSHPKIVGKTLQLGMKSQLSRQDRAYYSQIFKSPQARKALMLSVQKLLPKGVIEIERGVKCMTVPVVAIYGKNDLLLPNVKRTMTRVKNDLPQMQVHELDNCGHFLQEDSPAKVSELIVQFLGANPVAAEETKG